MKFNLIFTLIFLVLISYKISSASPHKIDVGNEFTKAIRELEVFRGAIKIKLLNKKVKVAKVIVKGKNIYVVFVDSSIKQLTFNDSDSSPIYLKSENKVLFIRSIKESNGQNEYIRKVLMKVDIENLKETIVTDKKPYLDATDRSDEIFNIINPTISRDSAYIYFIVEKYATSNQLVKVNLETGKWVEIISAESFELLKNEPYRNHFIVGVSEIRNKGRAICYKLIDYKGIVQKEFSNKESVEKFKSQFNE